MLQLTAGPTATMAKSHQATVEDYFSDDGNHGVSIEPFTPEPSPGKANVHTKRSNPEDMGSDRTPKGTVPNNVDVKSDSGYSSQSAAGMSSADSAASATSSQRSPPVPAVKPAPPSPTPAQKPSRPSQHHRQQSSQSTQSVPRLSRRDSQTSRRPPERRPIVTTQPAPPPKRRDSRNVEECTIPGCTKCGPDAIEPRSRPSRRQSMLNTQPAESAPDVSSYSHPYDTRSQVSDPAQYLSSPREDRAQRMYQERQGGPVTQPAISRRLSVNQRPARPTSYHGDPNHNWQHPGMPTHPGTPTEHGPPLSRSAYGNMHYPQHQPQPQLNLPYMQQFPLQGQHPPAFYQAQQMQPAREQQRPPLHARASHASAYSYPVSTPGVQVERSDRCMPSARYHSNALPQPWIQRNREEEVSEFESKSESESEEEDHEPQYRSQRMREGAPRRRPSLRHANTTPAPPAPEPKRPQTVVIPERRDPPIRDRADSRSTRRQSMSRPPLIPSIKSQSAYDTSQAHVIVEGSRPSRREALTAYDRSVKEHRRTRRQEYNEPVQSKRSSRAYENVITTGHDYERDYYDDEGPELLARAPLRRRGTDADPRRRHGPVIRQTADAEDYITASRGERDTLADQSYAIAKKRSSRTSAGPSEPESSRSRGSENNGEIRLLIANDAPVTFKLNGELEGRSIQVVPGENGQNELVISGNGRNSESTYRSERSSVRGDRKAIMPASQARRDAEEMTERSSQSSRRRRETRGEHDEQPRRVLQGRVRRERREPEYHHY
ncbi:uncharacterized protein M421DRAFT_320218 [Didymella exigua CBS 183.55]|uniref:Uncharacterized protein n=1 Tax=Didymella exigua CBS 183.55 TaxID=1150837 RepID=A0A6A5RX23_9PLEO|nr:uncharacterized protein M421DRAFT_320218 [Didymella exigua CBS 183.55]KAF1931764.1 hypothetical protein M421DRAFT_320218 [Didymella exigua CBS 183.55]